MAFAVSSGTPVRSKHNRIVASQEIAGTYCPVEELERLLRDLPRLPCKGPSSAPIDRRVSRDVVDRNGRSGKSPMSTRPAGFGATVSTVVVDKERT